MALILESIVLADYIIEATDGKKSVVGIFDKIFVEKLPTQQPKMWVYATVRGDEVKKEKLTLSIHTPDKKDVVSFDLEFSVPESGKATLMVNLEQLPLNVSGEHHIHLYHQDKDLGYYSFEIVQVKKNETKKVVN